MKEMKMGNIVRGRGWDELQAAVEHEPDPPVAEEPAPEAVPEPRHASAEAVLAKYEAAAKAVQAMGEEVKERISALQKSLADCGNDMDLIAEGAKAIRDKGKHAYALMEDAAAFSHNIHIAITTFTKQLVGEGPDQNG